MAKDKLTDYDSTASNNLDVGGISVAEGMLPSGVNNAIRELMSHQADAFGAGTPLYVDQTNNRVGVGVTDPIYPIEVQGEAGIELYNATGGGGVLNFRPSLGDASKYNLSISSYDHSGGGVGPADGLSINGFDGVSIATGSSTARQERMRIDSSGNVGIGTTSPTNSANYTSVNISGDSTGGGQLLFQENATIDGFVYSTPSAFAIGAGLGNYLSFYSNSSGSSNERMRIDSSGNVFMKTANSYIAGTTSLGFYGDAASSNGMFIDSSGNVGIGTTSPSAVLDIVAPANTFPLIIKVTTNSYNYITHKNAAGTDVAYTGLGGGAAVTTGAVTDYAIRATNNLLFGAGANTERMRIDSSGNLLVGRTSQNDTEKLSVTTATDVAICTRPSSAISFYSLLIRSSTNTTIGSVVSTTTSTSFNTSSDYRLKENVTATWDATTRLKQLNPVRFNFIANPDTTVDGFLAHEVQDIVPEAITGTKDAMRDEEYQVSAATGDIYTPAIEAVLDEDGNEVTPAVAEVIYSTDVERPEELAEGQQWRETTPAVMGTRSVPDYQGIDQSKLVPLLVKTIQELEARITALEAN